jgi:hypothetical protein
MDTLDTKSCGKVAGYFECKKCDYNTSRKSSYDKHLLTSKHLHQSVWIHKDTQNCKIFLCECGKKYMYSQGLSKHKKKCNNYEKKNDEKKNENKGEDEGEGEEEDEGEDDDEIINNNIIMEIMKQSHITYANNNSLIVELLKQNQDFKDLMIEQNKYMMEQSKQMMELAKNSGNNTNINNNTTHNKFNMQIFLNETCKDAMSITEFVNSLVLTFKDLEDLGRYGYTQGITNIFTRGLQATEVSKRPIHCSDIKRLIIYINDVNGWEKDNSSQEKVIQLIRKIAGKNLRQATEWMKINHSMIHGPDSHEQRQYLKMISQWFGGTDEENVKIYNKIIRNIAPQCYIDKYPALN